MPAIKEFITATFLYGRGLICHSVDSAMSPIFLKSFKPNREKGLHSDVVFTSMRSLRKPPTRWLPGGISTHSLDADPQKKDFPT